VENVVKKIVVFLFLIFVIVGCSRGWKKGEPMCVITMPYSVNTDSEDFLALSKTNWHNFLRGMERGVGEHIDLEDNKVMPRKIVGLYRPIKKCGKGNSDRYGAGVPGTMTYEECLIAWAKKIFNEDEDFCGSISNIVLMGAHLYGYKDEKFQIRPIMKKFGKGDIEKAEKEEFEEFSIDFQTVIQHIKEEKFEKMGRLAGEELAKQLK